MQRSTKNTSKKAKTEKEYANKNLEESSDAYSKGFPGNGKNGFFSTLIPMMRNINGKMASAENLKIMTSAVGMKSVEKFYLNFAESKYHENWSYICDSIMEIQSIRKLTLYARDADFFYPGFRAIIRRFAQSLESLKGCKLQLDETKCFPKLRQIKEVAVEEFKCYPVERYPLLKKASFTAGYFFRCPIVEQSPGITELCLQLPTATADLVLQVICAAGMVFPSVTHLNLEQFGEMQFTSTMLAAICRSFPNLIFLQLQVNLCDDRILSGLTLTLHEWLVEGWPLEKIHREASLQNLPGLEKLILGPDIYVIAHVFTYCVSKLPNLQDVSYYWRHVLSAEDVFNAVGHLKRITIVALEYIYEEKRWVEEMERLCLMLPTVVEIRKEVM